MCHNDDFYFSICFNGECRLEEDIVQIDGGWGEWQEWELFIFSIIMHIIAQRSNVIETDNSIVKIYHKDVLKADILVTLN